MRTTLIALLTVVALLLARSSSATVIVTSSPGFGLAQVVAMAPSCLPASCRTIWRSFERIDCLCHRRNQWPDCHRALHGPFERRALWRPRIAGLAIRDHSIATAYPTTGPTTVNTGFAGIVENRRGDGHWILSAFAFGRDNIRK